jgi:hypothetical protein
MPGDTRKFGLIPPRKRVDLPARRGSSTYLPAHTLTELLIAGGEHICMCFGSFGPSLG